MPSKIHNEKYANWRPFLKRLKRKKKKTHDQIYNDVGVSIEEFTATTNYLRARLPLVLTTPKVAIICGSGLGQLADVIENKVEFDYKEIPGFVSSTVQGHAGKLIFGLLGYKKIPIVCMAGRFHFYEGYTLQQVTFPVRIFKMLGVEVLIGNNPLFGPNVSAFGTRFPPMFDAYDYNLREIAFKAAESLKFPKGTLKEAIYTFYAGPSFETRAEARFLKSLGADLVGMSTVPEVIMARHCGIRVLGLSLVTCMVSIAKVKCADPAEQNLNYVEEPQVNHEEVLQVGKERASDMQKLVRLMILLPAQAFH
ncbi:19450_t:CDS:2 [Dentiscutata erythropus]|uniref:Purine nucleoside phosphorylase n=1 Tax=Dentiscutata erythropus TaxID=1348616 RepID=A0A9N9BDE1_9GLOM|nr:19450_t:CDS:2 [Dentiscutata erythropus]